MKYLTWLDSRNTETSKQFKGQVLVFCIVLLGTLLAGRAHASLYYHYDSGVLQSSGPLHGIRFSLEVRTSDLLPSDLNFNAVGLIEPMSSVLVEDWWFSVGSSFAEGTGVSLPGLMFLLFRTDASGSIRDWFFYVGTTDSGLQPSIAACSNSDGTVCGGIPDYVQLVGATAPQGYAWAQSGDFGTWSVSSTSSRPALAIPEPSTMAVAMLGLLLCVRVTRARKHAPD